MENDFSTETPSRPSGAQAQRVLRDLDSDRVALADRITAPRWLYPLFGLVVAIFIATPAIPAVGARNLVDAILFAVAIGLLFAYQRRSGVRIGRVGPRGAGLLVGMLVLTLVLLSTSFGLVSLLSAWWVLAPALVGFVAVSFAGRWFDRLYRENLHRGH
jgi:hypothetical protein